ncbi:MAG TPA: site-2 protease family protein [Ruminiclostridium sp.]|nr:site-2 protease family protein [Ruminiclostridium sp.]
MNNLTLEDIIIMVPILLIALPFHEFSHGWVAYKMGDPTAKYAGRLTLNPFKHLDLVGTIMMFAAGVGWAKPVPINPIYFKNRRTGTILVSLAGPLSNLVLSFFSMLVWGVIVKLVSAGVIPVQTDIAVRILMTAETFFLTLIIVNISLAVFNMIPVPPLDGSRLISSFIPEESYYRFARFEQYIGLAFLALVVFLPDNLFGNFLNFFVTPIYTSMAAAVQFILRI